MAGPDSLVLGELTCFGVVDCLGASPLPKGHPRDMRVSPRLLFQHLSRAFFSSFSQRGRPLSLLHMGGEKVAQSLLQLVSQLKVSFIFPLHGHRSFQFQCHCVFRRMLPALVAMCIFQEKIMILLLFHLGTVNETILWMDPASADKEGGQASRAVGFSPSSLKAPLACCLLRMPYTSTELFLSCFIRL